MDKKLLFNELHKLLDVFDQVCKRNNLKYSLFAGSLLGAVRHNGFIPWDDDIDVAMLREDYNKLLLLPSSEFEAPFFLQTPETDPGYHKAFTKLRNSNTTEIPYKDAIFNCNHGIFIDIFPLDVVPDSKSDFIELSSDLTFTKRLLHWTARVEGGIGTIGLDTKHKVFYYLIYPLIKLKIITSKKTFQKLNKISSRYQNTQSKKIGNIVLQGKNLRTVYEDISFAKTINHLFEGDSYPIPFDYDRVLKKRYGDWMTPVQQSSEHGSTVFDATTPYKKYIKEHKEELYELYLKYRV